MRCARFQGSATICKCHRNADKELVRARHFERSSWAHQFVFLALSRQAFRPAQRDAETLGASPPDDAARVAISEAVQSTRRTIPALPQTGRWLFPQLNSVITPTVPSLFCPPLNSTSSSTPHECRQRYPLVLSRKAGHKLVSHLHVLLMRSRNANALRNPHAEDNCNAASFKPSPIIPFALVAFIKASMAFSSTITDKVAKTSGIHGTDRVPSAPFFQPRPKTSPKT